MEARILKDRIDNLLATNITRFTYKPLDADLNEIRLLTLLPPAAEATGWHALYFGTCVSSQSTRISFLVVQ
jgi:hypothetical protein